jgi:DNA polymerase
VFGEGSSRAKVVFVGEVPGNDEDLQGRPFVGPAGKLLDHVLEEVGIKRDEIYLTNVVKHFKWEPAGKRRIHKKPNAREIAACSPWLDAELAVVKPEVLVCLGATAAQALLGKQFRVSRQRGELIPSPLAPYVMATVHPSSVLRAPDDEQRRAARQGFVKDMKKVAQVIHRSR